MGFDKAAATESASSAGSAAFAAGVVEIKQNLVYTVDLYIEMLIILEHELRLAMAQGKIIV